MTKEDPGWELYRSFLAVLREGSLSGAARALGLTQPTVGRHVRELESSLGTVLFTRGQSGLRPTEAAHTLEPYAQTMAGAAAAIIRAISEKSFEARAVVRIAASEIMGAEVLHSILTDFRARHPRVIVELSLSDRVEDLLRRDADIAVRMVRPKQGSLVARRIGSVTAGLHAHRRYLHERGQPNNVTELAQHVLIGFDQETASIRALQRLGLKLRRDDFAFRTDSHLAQLSAIRAGFGIGICQTVIARRDSNLVRVLPNDFAFDLEVWITMHEDLRATHPMRTIFDYLAAALSDYVRAKRAPER
jgi:DNA-binding transcriptional LysR family regulator